MSSLTCRKLFSFERYHLLFPCSHHHWRSWSLGHSWETDASRRELIPSDGALRLIATSTRTPRVCHVAWLLLHRACACQGRESLACCRCSVEKGHFLITSYVDFKREKKRLQFVENVEPRHGCQADSVVCFTASFQLHWDHEDGWQALGLFLASE